MKLMKEQLGAMALIVLFGCILSSCATTPVTNAAAVDVPAKRIVDSTLMQPMSNSGEITVKRDNGLTGSGCSTRVYIDAKPVADINPGEKVVLHLSTGEHIISAAQTGVCGSGAIVETKVTVQSGGAYNFRIAYGSNMNFGIYPTAF